MGKHRGRIDSLENLKDILEVASNLVGRIAEDPLLARLIAVFDAMPEDDRETIIGVLEREVLGRRMSLGTEQPVGQSARPNPHARLYIRAHEKPPDSTMFDLEHMRIANVQAMRVAPIIRHVPGIYALFKEALRLAMPDVDADTRQAAETLLRDALAAMAEAGASEPPASPKRSTGGG